MSGAPLRVSGRAFLLLLCLCCSRGWEVGSLVPVIGANPFWRNSTNAYNATVVRYSTVKQVATGGTHTVLLMTDGTIATYGLNGDGQLCLGDFADRAQPERVRHVQDVHPEFRMLREQFHHDPVLSNTELANVTAVAAGELHTVLLMGDGTVMTCGNGHHGQLGHGSDLNLHDNPQARASNSNWEFPTRIKVFLHDVWPKKLQYFRDVRAIDAAGYHTMLLVRNGSVFNFGLGAWGQLGRHTYLGEAKFRQSIYIPTIVMYPPGELLGFVARYTSTELFATVDNTSTTTRWSVVTEGGEMETYENDISDEGAEDWNLPGVDYERRYETIELETGAGLAKSNTAALSRAPHYDGSVDYDDGAPVYVGHENSLDWVPRA